MPVIRMLMPQRVKHELYRIIIRQTLLQVLLQQENSIKMYYTRLINRLILGVVSTQTNSEWTERISKYVTKAR
jgi:hypothetical protein